jgi:decaprenylphospho-beta-D-ribofuranose 2-oxidase
MTASGAVLRQSRFLTFDGAVSAVTAHQRPDRFRQLEADLGEAKRIARGAGLSYAAASFGEDVVVQEMTAFDRLLAFDGKKNTLRVEAGATLERVLEWAQPRTLRLAAVPGYPRITIGGCIAADAHGKNPARDGTFCDAVESFRLFHPSRGYREVTRDGDPDAFDATCGGFGLTGVIVDATLRLERAPAPNVRTVAREAASLGEAARALAQAPDADFAYSWHDGTARGERFGRGLVFTGAWTGEAAPQRDSSYDAMSASSRAAWPLGIWSDLSARSANALYRSLALRHPSRVQSAFDADFPFARQTLYHRLYGRQGLAELQLLVPHDALAEFVEGLAAIVERIGPPLVMLSMKRFSGRMRALSLSGEGMLVAMDLARGQATARFAEAIDGLAIQARAQPNVSKDSRLPADVAARTLPHYRSFRERLARVDPKRLYQSELSRRLAL